jgi:hypothetical protein
MLCSEMPKQTARRIGLGDCPPWSRVGWGPGRWCSTQRAERLLDPDGDTRPREAAEEPVNNRSRVTGVQDGGCGGCLLLLQLRPNLPGWSNSGDELGWLQWHAGLGAGSTKPWLTKIWVNQCDPLRYRATSVCARPNDVRTAWTAWHG